MKRHVKHGERRRADDPPPTAPQRPSYELIGVTVKTLRQFKGWRQTDLALRAGVAEGTITGVESGRRTQTTNLAKIATALSTTVADLREGRDVVAARAVGLTDEDIRIARLFHQGSTAIKVAVRRILDVDVSDIVERYERLDPDRQALIRGVLDAEERNQRNQQGQNGVVAPSSQPAAKAGRVAK